MPSFSSRNVIEQSTMISYTYGELSNLANGIINEFEQSEVYYFWNDFVEKYKRNNRIKYKKIYMFCGNLYVFLTYYLH